MSQCNCGCHESGIFLVCRDCGFFTDKHIDKWGSFENNKVIHHTRSEYNAGVNHG